MRSCAHTALRHAHSLEMTLCKQYKFLLLRKNNNALYIKYLLNITVKGESFKQFILKIYSFSWLFQIIHSDYDDFLKQFFQTFHEDYSSARFFYKKFFPAVHCDDSCTWFLQMILSNDSFTQFIQTTLTYVLFQGLCSVFYQSVFYHVRLVSDMRCKSFCV